MGLSKDAREDGLKAMVGGERWVGLATEMRGTGVVEVADPGYARQPAEFTEVIHDGARSVIATAKTIEFPRYVYNSDKEIRFWFVSDSGEKGKGRVTATGAIDPQFMLDRKAGKLLTPDEARGKKDYTTPVYPRPVAGSGTSFPAGGISLSITSEE